VGYLHRLIAAAVAALAVTAVGYVGNVVLLFAANGATAKGLASLASYFLLGAVVTLVVLFIAGIFGVFRRWYAALVAGLVGAPIGILLGLVMMLSGATFTGGLWVQILGTLVGVNFILWLAVTITAPTLGPVVWRAILRIRVGRRVPVALVRLPAGAMVPARSTVSVAAGGTDAAENDVAQGATTDAVEASAGDAPSADGAVDESVAAADEQWDGLVAALTEAGWQTIEVPVADDAPESVFVGDTLVTLGQTVVLTAEAGGARDAELADVELRLREYPLEIEAVEEPGGVSGSDVLVAGGTVYVAAGERTNPEGIRALREIAADHGYDLVALPAPEGARLRTVASVLPDGTVLADATQLGASAGLIAGLRPAPEPEGASVLPLDAHTILVSAAAPRTRELLESLGFTVVAVPIDAFEALGGSLGRLVAPLA